MRIATLAWALAATMLTAGPASAQDVGIRSLVEGSSLGGSLGGSDAARGVTDSAASIAAGIQRDFSAGSVVIAPDEGLSFEPENGALVSADPTTLIGLPLLTNDAAVVGKIRGVEIGEAGEPKALVVVLLTPTGSQEIRLPVELTTRQGDGIQVQASEADVRAFFSAETVLAEPRFALQNADPGRTSISPTSREAIIAPGIGGAATVPEAIQPVQTFADRSAVGAASAWEAAVSELIEGQVPSPDRVESNVSVGEALPQTGSLEVAAGMASEAEPAVKARTSEAVRLAKHDSAGGRQTLLMIGLALLFAGIASLAAWRWRGFLAGHLSISRIRNSKSKLRTAVKRAIPSPG